MKYNISFRPTTKSNLDSVDFGNIPFGETFSDHMFVADYYDGEWRDLRIVPFGPITMTPANITLHYGQSIFEGMKAFKNQDGVPTLFRPEMHAKRLNASAARMCMPDVPEDLFLQGLNELIGIDHAWIPTGSDSSLYVRPFMFGTQEKIGVKPSSSYKFIIFTAPVGPYYDKPIKLIAANQYVRAVPGGVGEAKAAGNYAAGLLPTQEAHDAGFDQIMWTDNRDYQQVQECGTMNIFFIIGDTVVTPETNGAILKGITRNTLIHLLRDKGIKVEERAVTIKEIVAAHEAGTLKDVFGAGTAAVIAPVSEISYYENKDDANYKTLKLTAIETRDISSNLKKELQEIRTGLRPDPHAWVHEVAVREVAAV